MGTKHSRPTVESVKETETGVSVPIESSSESEQDQDLFAPFDDPPALQRSTSQDDLISLEDIDSIVSMYLGPQIGCSNDLTVAKEQSQISLLSNASFEQAILESDNYYDECERRLYEVPRPKPSSDTSEKPAIFAWQRGELLGSGAYGSVYLGLNTDEGKWFAAKQVALVTENANDASQFVKALVQEINVLKTLKHENIVQYFGTQRDDKYLNIFLEFVPGGSIASIIKRFGKFKETLVSIYTKQILLGLEYLHRHQIMHRDIKGANILVDTNGVCKLADFGAAARLADLTQAQRRTIHGTPFWMAPEVIKQTGHGRQADIWSVGCTVIEMVTGVPPWRQFKTPVAALFHIASTNAPPELPSTLSPQLKDFILTCMQRDPSKRPNATRLLQHPFLADSDFASFTDSSTCGSPSSPIADAAAIQDFLSQNLSSHLDIIRRNSLDRTLAGMADLEKQVTLQEIKDELASNILSTRRQSL